MYSHKYQTLFSQCALSWRWSWLVRTWSTRQMNMAPESMESDKYRRIVVTGRRPIARFSPMLENNSRNILASGELKSENLSRNLRVTWLFREQWNCSWDSKLRRVRGEKARYYRLCGQTPSTPFGTSVLYVDILRVKTVMDAEGD